MRESGSLCWLCVRVLALVAIGAVLAGCGQPMEVESTWGPGLRFSETTRTWDWSPFAARTSGEGRPENPRVDELIRQSIEKDLAQRGYEKTTSGSPDFLIDYWAGKRVRGDTLRTREFTQFTEGTLAIDAYNPQNSKLIWRGMVRTAIDSSAPPEQMMKRLDLAIEKILDQLPSRKKPK